MCLVGVVTIHCHVDRTEFDGSTQSTRTAEVPFEKLKASAARITSASQTGEVPSPSPIPPAFDSVRVGLGFDSQ